jgi:hypothetical protein
LRPIKAADIVVTVTGTLVGGGDSFPIFDVGRSLGGKPFTLVFTFDDAKGEKTPLASCAGSASGINGRGANSPGTAVLTVGTKSYTFGTRKDAHSAAWREINSFCSQSLISFEIVEGVEPANLGVNIRIHPNPGKSLTQNPDWRAPVSITDMESFSNMDGGFFISRPGDFYHQAKSAFSFKSLTITGPKGSR